MMFLVAAVGAPSELLVQDTLKSAIVAFGALGAALLFVWQQRQRTTPLQWHGLLWLPLVLVAYALGSMVWSHTYLAGVEAIRWFVFALLLWLGLNLLTPRNTPSVLWSIHAGAVLASAWVVLQFCWDISLFPQGRPPASTFVNRNFFAEYLVCTLPYSVYLLVTMRRSRWLPWMAAAIAMNMVALMMTGMRSALAALLLLVPVMVWVLGTYRRQLACAGWRRTDRLLVALAMVGVVGVLGSVPSHNTKILEENRGSTALERSFVRTTSLLDSEEYTERSFYTRSLMWKATARLIMANPWAGVGAGAWEVQIPLYQRDVDGQETDYYAHNEYLQCLAEYGAVVGGLFVAFLLAYFLVAVGNTRRLADEHQPEAPLRAVALASLLALLLISAAGFAWRMAATGALFAVTLALLGASDARVGKREACFDAPMPWRPGIARGVLAALACAIVLASYITEQAALAEWRIVSAIKAAFAANQIKTSNPTLAAALNAQAVTDIRAGVAINPHYRKLSPTVAALLAASGDWADAVWIWDSVAASRPHIPEVWSNIARAYTQLGQYDKAEQALHQWQRLHPDAPGSTALEVALLNKTQREAQAIERINDAFNRGQYDFSLTMAAYAIGLKNHDWPLAIRSLELRNTTWPEKAADGQLRLGLIYADPAVHDEGKALAAFRAGMAAVPAAQRENFRSQVPPAYRSRL